MPRQREFLQQHYGKGALVKTTAMKMICAFAAIGILITVISDNPLPLVVMVAVSYAVWHVAKGFPDV